MNQKSLGELNEHRQRIQVLKAKLRSKQKAIIKASLKAQKDEAESKTVVKINNLIGQLKLKIISMQNTFNKRDFLARSPSPSSNHLHIRHYSAEYKEDQNVMVIKPSTRVSPVREEDLKRELGLAPETNQDSAERMKIKQNALINALRHSEIG